MQSSNSRLISGAVVTSLLLALAALIVFTLMQDGSPKGDVLVDAATATAVGEPVAADTPAPVANNPEETLPAAPEQTPADVDLAAAPAEGEVGGASQVAPQVAPTETLSAIAAPGIALTIQPTPTRRIEDATDASAIGTVSENEPTASTVDPASAPEEPLLAYANPAYVKDVVWLDGALWGATAAGAQRWDMADGEMQRFGLEEGLLTTRLRSVIHCPLEGMGLVFGSDAGLELHDPASGEWAHVNAVENEGKAFTNIGALACSEEAALLAIASITEGVAVYSGESGEWTAVASEADVTLTGVRALAIDDDGTLWLASGATIVQVVAGEVVEVLDADSSPLTGETVTDVTIDGAGALWATAGDRLFRLLDDEWTVYRGASNDEEFPKGTLVSIAPATGSRVWIVSNTAEVCRFDAERGACALWYADEEGMAQQPVTALAVGPGGEVAYATSGGGSSVLVQGAWSNLAERVDFPTSNRVYALASDASGYLWVATSGGVQQVNPARPLETVVLPDVEGAPTASNVRSLFVDSTGGVWLGGIGASMFNGSSWTNYTQADGLSNEEITAITQDTQGRIWFGTRAGLSIWTGTTFFNLTAANGLPDAQILSLASDANSVWIGSTSGGLYRFENNQLQVLTQENVGLPSDRILSLLVASDNSLYVGTDNGLARFARGEFNPVTGVPAEAIAALAMDAEGTLYAATLASGVWTQPAGAQPTRAWTEVASEAGALPPAVRALAVDLFGGLWIGTDDAGLVRHTP